MAHKKGMGSTKNGRDSNSKRLGVKSADGQKINAGCIIVGNEEQKFILVKMYLEEKMIPYLH